MGQRIFRCLEVDSQHPGPSGRGKIATSTVDTTRYTWERGMVSTVCLALHDGAKKMGESPNDTDLRHSSLTLAVKIDCYLTPNFEEVHPNQ